MSFFPQGSFYGIGLVGTSLDAFQYAENVTADNISNVNTPGASQQNVILTEAAPIAGSPGYAAGSGGSSGDGVVVSEVQRISSQSYDELFRGASSSQNYFQTEQQTLDTVQQNFGDPTSGINAQYTAFQAAVNQLVNGSSTGQTTSVNESVLSSAQSLASSLNSASNTVTQQEASVVQQAGTIVQTVNGLLTQIASLNGQIRASTAAGDNANTYEDQRDNDIDQLSQYISTQTSIQSDGSALVTVNGQALVNDTVAYQLSAPVIGTATNGASQLQINFASNTSTSASAAIPLGSGQLAGLADLYNNKLSVYGTQLDQFASSLANETNRMTEAGYTAGGQAGSALFQPIVATLPITAANIEVGITDPSQLPTALASTAAGTLVQPLNSSNNTVDTAASLTNNSTLANPPTAALAGDLTVTVDGVQQTFAYNTGSGGNASSIQSFITSFNAGQYGVDASFDTSSQSIVFTRDPTNESLQLRGQQGNNAETPSFSISDSSWTANAPASSLLGVLGAQNLQTAANTGVTQDASNALGAANTGVANSLVTMFSSNVGVPAIQFNSSAPAAAGQAMTIAIPTNTQYSNTVSVGQVLTIGGPLSTDPQENVTVTGVSYNNGVESVTFTPAQAHAAGFWITSAQTQTLGQFYGNFITQVGLDAQTAQTGLTTQTTLATNLDTARQSISGISLDEETQNLIQYQSAYTAAAQTMNILNQVLQTTITTLGAAAGSG